MKLDDETALSAYLDNELDPDPRRQVEEWLAADPALASRLADLLAIRGTVSALPRPDAPCRLSSAVLSRIASSELARSRRPYYWVATAASLAFGFALALRSGLIPRPRPEVIADQRVLHAVPSVSLVGVRADEGRPPATPDVPRPPAVSDGLAGPAVDRDAAARRRMVGILDRPGLGRILVVPDFDDPEAPRRVDDLLREAARKNPEYGRLTVAPGLAIDPRHPQGGEVFVAEMDDLERREFLGKLGKSFVTVVDEPSSDPGLGTQLAELDGITLGTGRRAAGLKPPPPDTRIALQHHDARPHQRKTDVLPDAAPFPFPGDPLDRGSVVEKSPDREDNPPEEPEAGVGEASRQVGTRPAGPVPVLIWVTPSRQGD